MVTVPMGEGKFVHRTSKTLWGRSSNRKTSSFSMCFASIALYGFLAMLGGSISLSSSMNPPSSRTISESERMERRASRLMMENGTKHRYSWCYCRKKSRISCSVINDSRSFDHKSDKKSRRAIICGKEIMERTASLRSCIPRCPF